MYSQQSFCSASRCKPSAFESLYFGFFGVAQAFPRLSLFRSLLNEHPYIYSKYFIPHHHFIFSSYIFRRAFGVDVEDISPSMITSTILDQLNGSYDYRHIARDGSVIKEKAGIRISVRELGYSFSMRLPDYNTNI